MAFEELLNDPVIQKYLHELVGPTGMPVAAAPPDGEVTDQLVEVLLNHGVVQQFLKSHYPTFRRAVPLTLRSRSLVAGVRIRRSRPAAGCVRPPV